MFNSLKYLEEIYNIIISSETKKNLDMYRNIINVYKHGYGQSYVEIEKEYPTIIQFNLLQDSSNTVFLFKLDIVNFENLYKTIISIIELF